MVGRALPPAITHMPSTGTALLLTPGAIQSSDVPINALPQTTPSVAGSFEGLAMPLISMLSIMQPACPQLCLSLACLSWPCSPRPCQSQPTLSIMLARPSQMGLLTAAPSVLNVQGAQYPSMFMPNPGGWQITPREQMLQDLIQGERQQFEAWKLEMESKTLALHSQDSQPQVQAPPIISSRPTVNDNKAYRPNAHLLYIVMHYTGMRPGLKENI